MTVLFSSSPFNESSKIDMSGPKRSVLNSNRTWATECIPGSERLHAIYREREAQIAPIMRTLRASQGEVDREFATKGPIYLLSNESGLDKTSAILERHRYEGPSIAIFVSGLHGLNLVCDTKAKGFCAIDTNPNVTKMMELCNRIIQESPTPREFYEKFSAAIERSAQLEDEESRLSVEREDLECLRRVACQDHPNAEDLVKCRWISTLENYQHIRDVCLRENTAFITGNLFSEKTIRVLANAMGPSIPRYVYVSNAPEWVAKAEDRGWYPASHKPDPVERLAPCFNHSTIVVSSRSQEEHVMGPLYIRKPQRFGPPTIEKVQIAIGCRRTLEQRVEKSNPSGYKGFERVGPPQESIAWLPPRVFQIAY